MASTGPTKALRVLGVVVVVWSVLVTSVVSPIRDGRAFRLEDGRLGVRKLVTRIDPVSRNGIVTSILVRVA